jgi:hypothetical protein
MRHVSDPEPTYLEPYARAATQYGAGFRSLLWASPNTQRARFDALIRLVDLNGRTLLDVGCGRADLLDHLHAKDIRPAHYVGLEGVQTLADAAEAKGHANTMILSGDFVREPVRMFVGAEVVYFSGSLNTLDATTFYRTIRLAYEATAESLVFNFLCAPLLAGAPYLHWRPPNEVVAFARTLTNDVRQLDDYLDGDCTLALTKSTEH